MRKTIVLLPFTICVVLTSGSNAYALPWHALFLQTPLLWRSPVDYGGGCGLSVGGYTVVTFCPIDGPIYAGWVSAKTGTPNIKLSATVASVWAPGIPVVDLDGNVVGEDNFTCIAWMVGASLRLEKEIWIGAGLSDMTESFAGYVYAGECKPEIGIRWPPLGGCEMGLAWKGEGFLLSLKKEGILKKQLSAELHTFFSSNQIRWIYLPLSFSVGNLSLKASSKISLKNGQATPSLGNVAISLHINKNLTLTTFYTFAPPVPGIFGIMGLHISWLSR